MLRKERWRDVWGGLGGSPYRYWRSSFLCEAGVGADGRFEGYDLAGRLLLACYGGPNGGRAAALNIGGARTVRAMAEM